MISVRGVGHSCKPHVVDLDREKIELRNGLAGPSAQGLDAKVCTAPGFRVGAPDTQANTVTKQAQKKETPTLEHLWKDFTPSHAVP